MCILTPVPQGSSALKVYVLFILYLTSIVVEAFGLFLRGGINHCASEIAGKGNHDNQEEENLGLQKDQKSISF